MSDRQNEVLNAIDATLSGYTDSDPVSSDAMRWSPREGNDEELTATEATMRRIGDGAVRAGRTLAEGFQAATQALSGGADRLHPWQMRMLSDVISAGPGRLELETRGRNVMGPRGFIRSGDSIPAHLSPGESMISGPNGPIHIRGAYGDEPMQVTEVDLDDIEGERT